MCSQKVHILGTFFVATGRRGWPGATAMGRGDPRKLKFGVGSVAVRLAVSFTSSQFTVRTYISLLVSRQILTISVCYKFLGII